MVIIWIVRLLFLLLFYAIITTVEIVNPKRKNEPIKHRTARVKQHTSTHKS